MRTFLLSLVFAASAFAQIDVAELAPVPGGTPAGTPLVFVQQTPANSANCYWVNPSLNTNCSLTSNITAGHTLLYEVSTAHGNASIVSTITGCAGTWTKSTSSQIHFTTEHWKCPNATGGSTTVVVTQIGAGNTCGTSGCGGNLSEWSGGTGGLDTTNTNNGTATSSVTAATVTTAAVLNELVIASISDGDNTGIGYPITPGGGFTSLNNSGPGNNQIFAYRLVTTTGTYGATFGLGTSTSYDTATSANY